MNLLVIRHGRAGSAKAYAETGAADDDLRPLTADGRERMQRGAAGLHRLVDTFDVLASSPLVRARQTAEILAAEFGVPEITDLDALRPGRAPAELFEWLREAGSKETVAIVGHEAHLSELVGWLVTGKTDRIVEIKKGAAVMVRVRGRRSSPPRRAKVLWSLAPRQLRALAG